MTLDDIFIKDSDRSFLEQISAKTGINETQRIIKIQEFDMIAKNRIGMYHQDSIIRKLRMIDEVSKSPVYVDTKGFLACNVNGTKFNLQGNNKSRLRASDIIVETTLPKSALKAIRTYAVATPPKIVPSDEADTRKQQFVKEFIKRTKLKNKLMIMNDKQISRGMLAVKNYVVENKSYIDLISADNICIIPDSYNISDIGSYLVFEIWNDKLYVELHKLGQNEIRLYELDKNNNILGDNCTEELLNEMNEALYNSEMKSVIIDTGLVNEFDIEIIHSNNLDDKSPYSDSVYAGLESTLMEIVTRMTANGHVFNKTSNPLLLVPPSVVEEDESGRPIVRTENAMINEDPDNKPSYVSAPTDQITSTYEHINDNIQQAEMQLGVNKIALGVSEIGGTFTGEAFKKAITITLNEAASLNTQKEDALVNVFRKAYYLETKDNSLEVSITWRDGITKTRKEELEESGMSILNDTTTRVREIMKLEKVSEEEARQILTDKIKENFSLEATEVFEDEDTITD